MTIIEQSRFLAMGAHYGINHKRKYTGEPYFQHLENVAKIVAFNGGTDEMIAAAYLHDILEDTKFPPSSLFQIIGERVFDMVLALTDLQTPENGNREKRKRSERDKLALASKEVQTIKLADLIDNTETIVSRDPNFAVVYMSEKRLLLQVLVSGDPILWKIANEQVEKYYRKSPTTP